MTETLDDNTRVSHPGQVRLSSAKLKALQPELYSSLSALIGWDWTNGRLWNRRSWWLTRITEHLLHGDSRAAVVIDTAPLLVAAYTDELDCIALLRFDKRLVSEYGLQIGSRLITVNLYEYMDGSYEIDLLPGPGARGYYRNFTPLIADFLTDDVDQLAQRKQEISEAEWRRTEVLGQQYLANNYAVPRDGRPFWCSHPAEQLDTKIVNSAEASPVKERQQRRFSVLEVPKRFFILLAFILLTLWGINEVQINPRVGWFGVLLFGTMTVASLVSIFRLPRDLKNRVGIGEATSLKGAYMWVGAFAVSVFLGLAGERILEAMSGPWPKLAIWFSSFITNAALYPFRGEWKKDYPNLTSWAIFSAVMGVVAVLFALFMDWLTG